MRYRIWFNHGHVSKSQLQCIPLHNSISHKLWSFAWPLTKHSEVYSTRKYVMLGTPELSFFTLSNDRNIYIFNCFSAWSAFTHEPELNSLFFLQCLHLVPPGMLHNRAWHWLAVAQDVTNTMGFCQWNLIHIYITIRWEARRAPCSLSAVDRNLEVCGPRAGKMACPMLSMRSPPSHRLQPRLNPGGAIQWFINEQEYTIILGK
jgi:hypothetical protein